MNYLGKARPGLAVKLIVLEGPYEGDYRTYFEEVGERIISLVVPSAGGAIVPISEGTVVEIVFQESRYTYRVKARIIQRIAVPIPLFVLEYLGDIEKIQRRNYVRIEAFFPLSYRVVTKNGMSEEIEASMIDLSGGGMRFRTRRKVEDWAMLYTRLTLPKYEIHMPAKVCRVQQLDTIRRWDVSIEFVEISEKLRDRIIRTVFDLQREMLKKGLTQNDG
jgi:c-di-GMP-binding flagellar brake protein YcgR